MKLRLTTLSLSTTFSFICSSLLITTSAFAAPVIDPITEPAASGAPYALSNSDLSSATETAYRPWFENGTWQGDLVQYNVSTNGSLSTSIDLTTTPPTDDGTATNWSARMRFDAAATTNSNFWSTGTGARKIITSVTGTDQQAFDWANLTSTQQTAIDSAAAGVAAASSDILDYIRGDRSNETDAATPGTLRKRYSILGDIVHSNPVYVGAPAASFNLPGYSDYKTKNKADTPTSGQADRTPIVYVGANDGMLHGFNASTGDEVFSYVPSMVFSNLSKLTADPYYHTYFVDGELSVGDINFNTTTPDWHTILVGGLGSGGKGMFALDVTHDTLTSQTAAAGTDKKILYELTGDDFGYIHGKAQIALFNDSKWYVVQGNGYSSVNDVAKLILIDTTGAVTTIATDGTTGNGLSSPALVDINGDEKPDYAYAGDIKGNLWKFDLTLKSSLKLFSTGVNQPITSVPDIARHPNGGVLVYFGTGSLLSGPNTASDDTGNTDAQAFYAIWDNSAAALIANDAAILNQPLTEKEFTAGTIVRYSTNNTAINWSTHKGWKVPFPTSGERLIGDPQLRAGRLQFITTSFNADNQPVAWLMELNYLNGGDNGNVIFDLDADGIRDGVDTVNRPVDGAGDPIGTGDIPVALKYGSYGIFAQPTIARVDNSADTLLVNGLLMPQPSACSGSCSTGFIGGHIDVDTDSPYGGSSKIRDDTPNSGSDTDGHQHEYDKEHGAVYVDWFDLEPRRGLETMNIAKTGNVVSKLNRITETCDPDDFTPGGATCKTTTATAKRLGGDAASLDKKFFIVLANADINLGGRITIGSKSWPVKEYQDMVTQLIQAKATGGVLADTSPIGDASFVDAEGKSLIYTIRSIKADTDASGNPGTIRFDFDSKAIVEGRIQPTIYNCVWGSDDPYEKGTNPLEATDDAHITNAQEKKVTGYRWRNGALTVQMVDATNYKLQTPADLPRADVGLANVGGTHIYNYTQTKFFDSGDFITAAQQINTAPIEESGLLYEGAVFNHWGSMYMLRTGKTRSEVPCYGEANYNVSVAIERAGLTLGEYQALTTNFVGNATLQADFAAALAALENATSEADLLAAKAALKKIVDDNGLGDYMKYRTYIRSKIPPQHLLDFDKKYADTTDTAAGKPAEVQDGTKDDDQLGQNFRTGRRTWIDLTP